MNELVSDKKRWTRGALVFLPACYLVLGIYFCYVVGDHYLWTVDPEYAYLFNGLNVAQPSLKVWHADHPGTPFQVLIGLIVRITFFFKGGNSLNESVFQDPEFYLGVINLTMITASCFVLLWLGRIVYKGTGRLLPALFLQTTPFLSQHVFHAMMRVSAEQMLIVSTLLLAGVTLRFIYSDRSRSRHIVVFALVMALGVASKITFAAAFFIPLLLLPEWRKRLSYMALTAAFFLLFILPVIIYRHAYFVEWIGNLFSHSGQHGRGAEEVVNKTIVHENLQMILMEDWFYPAVFLIGVISIVLYQVRRIKKAVSDPPAYRALVGCVIATLFNLLLVAKHYSYHYLLPSLLLMGLEIYLIRLIFFKKVNPRILGPVAACLVVVFLSYRAFQGGRISERIQEEQTERRRAADFAQANCKEHPSLIIPGDYNCAYKEYAMTFGLFWGGNYFAKEYHDDLAKIYPNSYLYGAWDKRFYGFNPVTYSLRELLTTHKEVYLYSIKPDITQTLTEFDSTSNLFPYCTIKRVFENPGTSESIFELKHLGQGRKITPVVCDAEKTNSEKHTFLGNDEIPFGNSDTQSNERSRSGRSSSKVSAVSQFGMTRVIKGLYTGDTLRICVWRHRTTARGALVASLGKFYFASGQPDKIEGGWERLSLVVNVLPEMVGGEFVVYVLNNEPAPAYFDDLEITMIPAK